jgi:hypothetical protein
MSGSAAGQMVTGIRFLLNIIWLVLCGFWLAILYVIAGVIMCVLIIAIPFGLQAFKIAGFILWPFGRTVVRRADAGAGSVIGNILWLVLVGWWLAIGHIVTAIALVRANASGPQKAHGLAGATPQPSRPARSRCWERRRRC